MANAFILRGGTPDFKGFMCDGQASEWLPPYDTPSTDYTPPFNSHADAAMGQGWLNLQFPLVPNLDGSSGHNWMQSLLAPLAAVNDVIFTNWVPNRAFLNSYYLEVTHTDARLDGVYVTPVAYRHYYDYTTRAWVLAPITEFTDELTAVGITQFPLGTPQAGDKLYGIARLSLDPAETPSTFGHNIVTRDAQGDPIGGVDTHYGHVLLGLKITQGDPAKIKLIASSNIAVYTSAKLVAFEGSTQVG